MPASSRQPLSARNRILTDDKIRDFWQAVGELGHSFGLLRRLLLTGQRRDEVGKMAQREVEGTVRSMLCGY